MPELPEVETAARDLAAQITGQRIVAIEKLDWERMVETPAPAALHALLPGRQLLQIGRRAKWVVATLDADWTLAIHLRMSGNLSVHTPDTPADKHTHLVLLLDDGRRVFFHDPRKFGRVRLLDPAGLHALDAAHGVEPLSAGFTPPVLRDLLTRHHRYLKPLLLDQTIIAGLGNIYVDESLWQARLHPLRHSDSLKRSEITALHSAIQWILTQAIENKGSTLRDYRTGYGQRGGQQEHFRAYGRTGMPCLRCGTPIERVVVGQRSTHLCPTCQPLHGQRVRRPRRPTSP
jgi:formamidopyrimidine-DNA glycosylase